MKVAIFLIIFSTYTLADECGQTNLPSEQLNLQQLSCEEATQAFFDQACEAGLPMVEFEMSEELTALNNDFELLSGIDSLEDARNIEGSSGPIDLAMTDLEFNLCNSGPQLPVENAPSPEELCLRSWKINRATDLFDSIFDTPDYRASEERLREKFRTYGASLETALQNPWYFELSPNNESNLSQMNRILRRLPGTLMSERSSERIMESLSETMDDGLNFSELDVSVNAGLLVSPTKVASLLGVVNVIRDQTTSILVNKNMVLANMNPVNDYFIDFVMAHEMAHHYTAHVDRLAAMRLSRDSREDIKKRHRACMYSDRSNKKEIGEDLADLLAHTLVENTRPNVSLEEFQALAFQLCQAGSTESEAGHSSGIERLQNLVKYNPTLQNHLNCREDRLSCTIRTTPLTGDEETY